MPNIICHVYLFYLTFQSKTLRAHESMRNQSKRERIDQKQSQIQQPNVTPYLGLTICTAAVGRNLEVTPYLELDRLALLKPTHSTNTLSSSITRLLYFSFMLFN